MNNCLFFLSFLFLTTVASAQVVNIESERLQSDTTGWLGSASANFCYSKNTIESFTASASAQIEYKAKKDLILFLGEYSLINASNQDFLNGAFAHLRYNRKFDEVLRWEAFGQAQFNKLTLIDERWLLGTGPRFKLVESKHLKLYYGTLYMFEHEDDADPENTIHNDHRIDTYVSFTWLPIDNLRLVSTTYFQPLFADFNDYRILNQETLSFIISKHFEFTPKWSFLYDTKPVVTVPKETISFTTGLKFNF